MSFACPTRALRSSRFALALGAVAWLACATTQVQAQSAGSTAVAVYRCPGPPVLYTDAISPQEAKERSCRTIEGAPITVIQGRPVKPVTTQTSPASGASRPAEGKIDPLAQRARDSDARRILEAELKREEDRLAALQKDFNKGEPERRGDERNAQKYLDRISDMKAGLARKEADIAAIKRELSKFP